jgi:hypothetical protein
VKRTLASRGPSGRATASEALRVRLPVDLARLLDRWKFRESYARTFAAGHRVQPHWHPDREEIVLPLEGRAMCRVFRAPTARPVRVVIEAGRSGVFLPHGAGHELVALTDCSVLILATRRGTKRPWPPAGRAP